MLDIHTLLEQALVRRAADILLKSGRSPMFRVDGVLCESSMPSLTPSDCMDLARSVLYSSNRDRLLCSGMSPDAEIDVDAQLKQLKEMQELDTVFTIPCVARVRANLFLHRATMGIVLRVVPLTAPTIASANLPAVLHEMVQRPQGLVLISGPTGSGKTTTLAALIEEINQTRAANIVTIEDPIEYVFEDKRSVVLQREVGTDTASFDSALRSVLRQNPDVIAVGELRDARAIRTALTAAELGHLVLATVHTASATACVRRLINVLPPDERDAAIGQLSANLLCAVSQRLVKRKDGSGRIPAAEVMTDSPTIRKLIDERRLDDLHNAVRDGEHYHMCTLNQSLESLVLRGLVDADDALAKSPNPMELRQLLRHA